MSHSKYLKQALELATTRRGFCAPNPAVGAIVVKDDQILATGVHWAAGEPHAEAVALAKLDSAAGATIYITLEPCCHFGKTPPCTDLLIAKGIREVVYGFSDPNPVVRHQSEAQLTKAGVAVHHVVLPEITEFYRSYAYWWANKRPFVTAKIALSMDGKIAGEQGEPIALTGSILRDLTHQKRKSSDAILTTINTILTDNPQLNARFPGAVYNKPIYVLDSRLRFPLTANLLQTAAPLIVFYNATEAESNRVESLQQLGVECVAIPGKNGKLDLNAVLDKIGQDGKHDLWVEAGGECFQALYTAELINEAYIYIAPKWLGEKAKTAFNGPLMLMNNVKNYQWYPAGEDVYLRIEIFS